MVQSKLEREFINVWSANFPKHLPLPQFQFNKNRKYRFDFAWLSKKLALEIQGNGPGHTTIWGMTQDYDKQHDALILGWKVVYITGVHLREEKIDSTLYKLCRLLDIKEGIEGYENISTR